MTSISRRHFLQQSAVVALGFGGLRHFVEEAASATPATPRDLSANGYGPLRPDPRKLLDLPRGFSYRVVSRTGDAMSDGLRVPGQFDGMGAFLGPQGTTILIRNHELEPVKHQDRSAFGPANELLPRLNSAMLYDPGKSRTPGLGGTTTLVYDTRSGQVQRQFLSLAGTIRNCAGGPTPWNSWISCEETVLRAGETPETGTAEKDHGYNFEVPASATPGLAAPVPLRDMGRFNHEAVAVDARSGIVYQTEDRGDGLIYRFIPRVRGRLALGGRLQALKIKGQKSVDTRNWGDGPTIKPGRIFEVEWIDMRDVESPQDDLRLRGFAAGAARFARGEGIWTGRDAIYFACTNGGPNKTGQIWRYVPSAHEGRMAETAQPGRLELWVEPNNSDIVENCDNVTVAPWGDLVVCEDGGGQQFVVGVTPRGRFYRIARNATNGSEFAGAVFSPDGSTLFVNIQSPGHTFAITGPWRANMQA